MSRPASMNRPGCSHPRSLVLPRCAGTDRLPSPRLPSPALLSPTPRRRRAGVSFARSARCRATGRASPPRPLRQRQEPSHHHPRLRPRRLLRPSRRGGRSGPNRQLRHRRPPQSLRPTLPHLPAPNSARLLLPGLRALRRCHGSHPSTSEWCRRVHSPRLPYATRTSKMGSHTAVAPRPRLE